MEEAFLYDNAFTGTLPATIGQWSEAKEVSFWNNRHTGQIPDTIVNWVNIRGAWFDDNAFTGTIPSGICQYIDDGDLLRADCVSDDLVCTCCTDCW